MNDKHSIDRRTMLAQLTVGLATATITTRRTFAQDAPANPQPFDHRLGPLHNLDGYFPFTVPSSKEEWTKRADQLRRQLLVANGLWPMPTKHPLQPVIYGKIERDDFTVERVFFQSSPGLYVTGSLFRPKADKESYPAILSPHGHWNHGRFFDHTELVVRNEIKSGAEKFPQSGRFPLQARCAQLARMGCIVFHYDMLGYADSVPIPQGIAHGFRQQRPHMNRPDHFGLFSAQAELRLLSPMGLQTWNSVRALDFLLEHPDVDQTRIGITGASGGGTQSFILTAIDDRITASFPAVMVSTAMQGGCTCENASYLRIGTGNIEIAALAAPRPLGMTAANDWTKELETKGLPELQKLYEMLGVPENVTGKYYPFPHNYNYVSRAMMYEFFNKHFQLGLESPIVEPDFQPLTVAELTVWNDEHPKPKMDENAEIQLLQALADDSDKQIENLTPHDANSLDEFQKIVGGGWNVLIGRDSLPIVNELPDHASSIRVQTADGIQARHGLIQNPQAGETVAFDLVQPAGTSNRTVIWVSGRGRNSIWKNSRLIPPVEHLLNENVSVLAVEPIGLASAARSRAIENGREAACFVFGYNHPLFAQRVHDILNAIALVVQQSNDDQSTSIDLVGLDGAGPWVAAAAMVAKNHIRKAAIDTGGFRFRHITDIEDPQLLPGAVKYADLPALLGLCAPLPILLVGEGADAPKLTKSCYRAAGAADRLLAIATKHRETQQTLAKWLIGKE